MTRADFPIIDATSRPYWDGARAGRLLIARCRDCQRVHHYPRSMCPHCWSLDIEPVPASGRGTVYTYSTVHVNDLAPFSARLPYTAAMVELEEGPRLMTLIEGTMPDRLHVGSPVTVSFRPIDEDDPDSPYLTVFTAEQEQS